MWDLIDKSATIVGLISAIIAAWQAWNLRRETQRKWQKDNEQICVKLRDESREIKLAIELQRGNLNRAELLGLIGMLPMNEKGKRFEIAFLNTHGFSESLKEIRNSDDKFDFIVQCTPAELDDFKYPKNPISSPSLS